MYQDPLLSCEAVAQRAGGFMGSLHDFRIAHRNHEPVGIPLNRPPGTFSPTGGEGRDEGVRFMERDVPRAIRSASLRRRLRITSRSRAGRLRDTWPEFCPRWASSA